MEKFKISILFIILLSSCRNENKTIEMQFLVDETPTNIPFEFKQNIVPVDKLIHKGTFSPDLKEYYYTISDYDFKRFKVYRIKKLDGNWSEPKLAFFNSEYDEHGMSFSPDGNTLYFSSTRPTNINGVSETWHLWKSTKVNSIWQEPVFIDIPNLRDKLVSHPTIANTGTLYFHVSNLDYSEMEIYHSKKENGTYGNAEKTPISMNLQTGKCTPYVSPQEDYLIFASITNELELMISYNDGNGNWVNTKKLNNKINNKGQGNPYVTPDDKFLFYTTGGHLEKEWKVKWVNIESVIHNKE